MPDVSWTADPSGAYWIDVQLAGRPFNVLIDTGLIDRLGEVGFSIEASDYDAIKKAGGFRKHQIHSRMMADGTLLITESGSLDAQLICPQTLNLVGPVAHVYVYRGAPGVPDRVGLAFFHQLKGCKVLWDLDQRTWRIDYP
jgi:hypothetical protein